MKLLLCYTASLIFLIMGTNINVRCIDTGSIIHCVCVLDTGHIYGTGWQFRIKVAGHNFGQSMEGLKLWLQISFEITSQYKAVL